MEDKSISQVNLFISTIFFLSNRLIVFLFSRLVMWGKKEQDDGNEDGENEVYEDEDGKNRSEDDEDAEDSDEVLFLNIGVLGVLAKGGS